MVERMRADCLIVDSTAGAGPCPLTWAHCLDPGIPLASQPGQPNSTLFQGLPKIIQMCPQDTKSTQKAPKIEPWELTIHEKVKKVKPIKNISIYYVFNTFKHWVLA